MLSRASVCFCYFILALPAFGQSGCSICGMVAEFEKEMVRVPPNIYDTSTIEAQDKIIDKAGDILNHAFSRKHLGASDTEAVVNLSIKLIPYDNGLLAAQQNMIEFKRHYNDGGLKKMMTDLVNSRKLSRENHDMILEYFGAIPAQDRLPH